MRNRALEKWVWGAGAVTAFIVIGGIVGDLNIIPDKSRRLNRKCILMVTLKKILKGS